MQAHIVDNAHAIGYLDAGHGIDFGLSEVALTNADGASRTAKQSMALGGVAAAGSAGVTSGVFPSDVSADWSAVNLYDMAGQTTWPIVLVSYLYVDKDQTMTNPRTAAALKAFIDFIVNNRDELCQEFGFTPPSQALKDLAMSAANSIAYPSAMTSFAFETSTDPLDGMGANIVSSKRHAADDYERSVLAKELADLMAQYTPQAPNNLGGTTPAPVNADKETDSAPLIVSATSIGASLISMCLGFLAIRKRSTERGYEKEGAGGAAANIYGNQS